MPREYKPSQPLAPISVNVDEWMAKAHGPKAIVKPTTQVEVDQLKAELREYKENYLDRNERMARQAALTPDKLECTECGRTEHFYKDDYICYQCREKLGT